MKIPLAKNNITATSDGHCMVDKPAIPCPLVHPPAYRVPNPTRKPPPTTINKCCQLSKFAQLNISTGNMPGCLTIPKALRLSIVAADNGMGSTGCNATLPMRPPIKSPAAKKRFHDWFFQLYLRNGILAGKHIAQIWRMVLEIPKVYSRQAIKVVRLSQ